ncbi:MAG: mechanosensitive ion channel [Proteobacteria bacterium]|nr:mechanosensitive ion channel [Pseudomonadota bacterium]
MENVTQLNPDQIERHLLNSIDNMLAVVTTYGLRVIGAFITLFIGWAVANAVHRAIHRAGVRSMRIDPTITMFAASGAKYLIVVFTLISVLGSFGIQTTSFVAVLGAAGLAIGLALQGTLSHVASGLLLVFFRPFRVGDAIEAGGVTGTVRSITLFVTEIDTADNVHVVVPNGLIWSGMMKNFTRNATRRVEIKLLLSYVDDATLALKIVHEIVARDERVLESPPPQIGLASFADTGITILVQVWTAIANVQSVQFDLNRAVKDAFDKKGITMSFAQRKALLNIPPPPVV